MEFVKWLYGQIEISACECGSRYHRNRLEQPTDVNRAFEYFISGVDDVKDRTKQQAEEVRSVKRTGV